MTNQDRRNTGSIIGGTIGAGLAIAIPGGAPLAGAAYGVGSGLGGMVGGAFDKNEEIQKLYRRYPQLAQNAAYSMGSMPRSNVVTEYQRPEGSKALEYGGLAMGSAASLYGAYKGMPEAQEGAYIASDMPSHEEGGVNVNTGNPDTPTINVEGAELILNLEQNKRIEDAYRQGGYELAGMEYFKITQELKNRPVTNQEQGSTVPIAARGLAARPSPTVNQRLLLRNLQIERMNRRQLETEDEIQLPIENQTVDQIPPPRVNETQLQTENQIQDEAHLPIEYGTENQREVRTVDQLPLGTVDQIPILTENQIPLRREYQTQNETQDETNRWQRFQNRREEYSNLEGIDKAIYHQNRAKNMGNALEVVKAIMHSNTLLQQGMPDPTRLVSNPIQAPQLTSMSTEGQAMLDAETQVANSMGKNLSPEERIAMGSQIAAMRNAGQIELSGRNVEVENQNRLLTAEAANQQNEIDLNLKAANQAAQREVNQYDHARKNLALSGLVNSIAQGIGTTSQAGTNTAYLELIKKYNEAETPDEKEKFRNVIMQYRNMFGLQQAAQTTP